MDDSPTVIDLFAGAGGFSLGASLAGFDVKLAVEKDKTLSASHSDNFPTTPLLHADITALTADELLSQVNGASVIDGVIGGPPCQGFSEIGHRDPDDPRNSLIGDYFRLVRDILPAFFVFENVPGILHDPHAEQLHEELRALEDTYHIVGPVIIDAANCGAATHRKRAIIAGVVYAETPPLLQTDLAFDRSPTTVEEAFEGLPPMDAAFEDDDGVFWSHYPDSPTADALGPYASYARSHPPEGLASKQVRSRFEQGIVSGFKPTNHTDRVTKRFSTVDQGDTDDVSWFPRLDPAEPSPTIRAGTGPDRGSFQAARPIHPQEDRVITVREAARIQGFPDWFQFHPTKWHSFRMIGNSVSPLMARAVMERISDSVLGSDS